MVGGPAGFENIARCAAERDCPGAAQVMVWTAKNGDARRFWGYLAGQPEIEGFTAFPDALMTWPQHEASGLEVAP